MEYLGLFAALICILIAMAVARRIEGSIFTLPMIYTVMGLLIGSRGLGLITFNVENELISILIELTLVFVLATDAARINLRRLVRDHSLPIRLLGIGLPLTMIAGTLLAYALFSEMGLWAAAILGIVLTPTDAGLGQAVVTNRLVPVRIRQALNIESGLNDGIAMPFLVLAIALALASERPMPDGSFIVLALSEITLGLVAGVVVGFITVYFIGWGERSGWMSTASQKVASMTLIILAYTLAEMIGGNGFIAAFCMGATAGNLKHDDDKPFAAIREYSEVEVQVLMMVTFILFGSVMLPPALDRITVEIIVYVVLSLTLVRMIPVAISLIGSKVRPRTMLFLGWFGPRGIASIIYIFTVFDAEMILGRNLIYDVAMLTVFVSILAHGVSAAPLASRYGRYMASVEQDSPEAAEMAHVPEMPTRAHPHTLPQTK